MTSFLSLVSCSSWACLHPSHLSLTLFLGWSADSRAKSLGSSLACLEVHLAADISPERLWTLHLCFCLSLSAILSGHHVGIRMFQGACAELSRGIFIENYIENWVNAFLSMVYWMTVLPSRRELSPEKSTMTFLPPTLWIALTNCLFTVLLGAAFVSSGSGSAAPGPAATMRRINGARHLLPDRHTPLLLSQLLASAQSASTLELSTLQKSFFSVQKGNQYFEMHWAKNFSSSKCNRQWDDPVK